MTREHGPAAGPARLRLTKLAIVLFTRELHRRYHAGGLSAATFHPGLCQLQLRHASGSRLLVWVRRHTPSELYTSTTDAGRRTAGVARVEYARCRLDARRVLLEAQGRQSQPIGQQCPPRRRVVGSDAGSGDGMLGVHHSAICTADVERSLAVLARRPGLAPAVRPHFTGDWPELFGAKSDRLRSIFLGDPQITRQRDRRTGGVARRLRVRAALPALQAPRHGFFLLSLQRDVDETLSGLAALGFTDGVRRITVPAPGGKTVAMAVITAPGRRAGRVDRSRDNECPTAW